MKEDAQKTFHCWEHDKFLPWIMTIFFRFCNKYTGKQEQIFTFGKNILEKNLQNEVLFEITWLF
jgi:hypothetical protein